MDNLLIKDLILQAREHITTGDCRQPRRGRGQIRFCESVAGKSQCVLP